MSQSSSVLFGLDGVVVETVFLGPDGTRTVGVTTAPQWVGRCPACATVSTRSKGWVTTRPRDIKIGPDRPKRVWRKRKWMCSNSSCDRRSFTESIPQIPPRARITGRAKAEMALAVLDDDRSVKAVAAAYGCTWNTCHTAVAVTADPILEAEPERVVVLGIDETRRGKAKWETCPDTGQRSWVDRWDTGLVDIAGGQGLSAQVNGRTSAAVTGWLDARDPAWKQAITHVAIDMSTVYAKAVREGLPHAQLIVDRFHLVKKVGRDGRHGPAPGHPGRAGPAGPQERCRVDQSAPAAAGL
jgi:transposase